MDRYLLAAAGINVGEGVARFSGNEALYEKFLFRFSSDDNFTLLCQAIEADDAQAAFTAAHTLKGVTGNLSLTRLYDDLLPLVEELRRRDLTHAKELLQPVKQDYDAILAVLANL